MHRMMPYELVGIPERQEVMEKINRDPNRWVQSLKTFGKYGFFIECDIEAPIELHDKFSDLPFFPVQKAGMYSDGIKKYAAKNDIVDKVKERSEERHRGQSERDEYTEAHLRSCTSSKVSRALLSVVTAHSTGISRHAHPPHHSFQAGTVHLRVREHAE